MSITPLTFDPPGPGSWSIDSVHFSRPFSLFQAEIHPPNLAAGFTECMRRYGLLLETLEYAVVNGFAYSTPRPAPASEIPERFEAAARAFETRLWRDRPLGSGSEARLHPQPPHAAESGRRSPF